MEENIHFVLINTSKWINFGLSVWGAECTDVPASMYSALLNTTYFPASFLLCDSVDVSTEKRCVRNIALESTN